MSRIKFWVSNQYSGAMRQFGASIRLPKRPLVWSIHFTVRTIKAPKEFR